MTANITVLQHCHYDAQATVRYPLAYHQGQQPFSRVSPLIKRAMINRLTSVMRKRVETRSREGILKEQRRNTIFITTRGVLIRTGRDDRNPHCRNRYQRCFHS